MPDSIVKIFIFFAVGVGMAVSPIVLSFLLWRSKNRADSSKQITNFSKELEPYESGMPAEGLGRGVGFEYFIYAILFLLFDVIAILAFLGVLALHESRSEYLWPFFMLLCLSLFIIVYGVKKREYLKI
ncbi:MAG: NADH-quinone oxidoreductase subunit A [bacterium]|nr:NADH-quinone oxidoreductase subunit A [bacterium]